MVTGRALNFLILFFIAWGVPVRAELFRLPTPNEALIDGGGDAYYVGTVSRTWESGTYGCVRTDGWQFHEGLDIKCVRRDDRGEPIDPIYATAKGEVVYRNDKVALSNYGKYLILRHEIEGLEICSLYAHLSEIREDLHPGTTVQAGERIATMGRTANTRQRISQERAHLHFELCLVVNHQFDRWHDDYYRQAKNDHGRWNGRNLIGIDPAEIFRRQSNPNTDFSLLHWLRHQPVQCRILVRETHFSWVNRYYRLIKRNTKAQQEGIAGYEIAFNHYGLPFQMIPRAESEIETNDSIRILSVNEPVWKEYRCRHVVHKPKGWWELNSRGRKLLDLLTY